MKETFIPKSTRIDEVVYDSDEQSMVITFRDGRAYKYDGVPQSVYMGIQNAQSAGSYFGRQIMNVYPSEEI